MKNIRKHTYERPKGRNTMKQTIAHMINIISFIICTSTVMLWNLYEIFRVKTAEAPSNFTPMAVLIMMVCAAAVMTQRAAKKREASEM